MGIKSIKLISVPDLADHFNRDIKTVRRWTKQSGFPIPYATYTQPGGKTHLYWIDIQVEHIALWYQAFSQSRS